MKIHTFSGQNIKNIMIIKFCVLYICVIFTEVLLNICFSSLISLYSHDTLDAYIFNSIRIPIGVNLVRIMFYFIPFVMLFWLFFKHLYCLGIIYKPLQFSVFNTFVFLALNFFYKLTNNLPTLDIAEPLMLLLVTSLFLAPLLLGQILYFKRLMDNF